MKKLTLLNILIFTPFLFMSCATIQAGKIVKSSACRKIERNRKNNHHFKLSHVMIDYSYTQNKSNQMIAIEGAVDKLSDADRKRTFKRFLHSDFYVVENKELEEAYIDFFFLDTSRKVLSARRIQLERSPIVKFPLPFKTVFPFNKEYKYIALAYKFVFTSTNPKASNMKKVYEHELDIQ